MSNIWNRVSEAKDELVKDFRTSGEVADLNRKIDTAEQRVETAYKKIGQIFYEKNEMNSVPDEYQALFAEVRKGTGEINMLSRKVLIAKHLVLCPKCHEKCDFDMTFCGFCGCDLTEAKAALDPTPKCPKCGASLIEGSAFCGGCGARIENAPADAAEA